ncbi:MAG: O-acetyl-ADP-ribose deacetylase [Clostridiales bacterium]|nr:O-acetyl-ADP-ribose deacetylase [Clostridiales bacterium]
MPFTLVRNDITKMRVDAIVNAANHTLLGGGGVDGAIHRAAGPKLLEECRGLGGCRTGEAKLTKGYDLPARYVIHTVGPIWMGGSEGEEQDLEACYLNSLKLAKQHGLESVAFPLISAGAYGYPPAQALSVAATAILRFLRSSDMTVYLVIFGPSEFVCSKKLFGDVKAYVDDVYVGEHLETNTQANSRRLADERELRSFGRTRGKVARSAPEPLSAPLVHEEKKILPSEAEAFAPEGAAVFADAAPDWEKLLKQADDGFSQTLLRLIDEKGMSDVECYKKANVDRKLFSKIRSNPGYKPAKTTALAFAVALGLSLEETKRLLVSAGFAVSHSSKLDIIVEYFIKNRIYDIYEINQVLFRFDMPLLGSGMN